jgi:hypothetical protein
MKKFTSALLAGASILVASSAANAGVLDEFDTPSPAFSEEADYVPGDFMMNEAGMAAGVSRLVSATRTGGTQPLNIGINSLPGLYTHSQAAGTTGTSSILYENIAADQFADLLTTNAFRIVASADLSGGQITLTVDGESASIDILPGGDLNNYDVTFADLNFPDLTDGATIQLFIDGTARDDLDIRIDTLGTVCSAGTNQDGTSAGDSRACGTVDVSEPASLGLLGLGLVGIGAAVRRRKA